MSKSKRFDKYFPPLFSISIFLSFICFTLPVHAAVDASLTQQEKKEYLTSDERLKTTAVQLFIDRHYVEALGEFKVLEQQYPKDTVIKRYIAACISPAPTSKKWNLYGQEGVEWQKNPALASRERRFARERSESAVVFYSIIHGKYELLRKNAWTLHGAYRHYESFYSDAQDERNFGTSNLFVTLTYDRLIKSRPFLAQFTSTVDHALHHGVAHSWGLPQSLTLAYSPHDWYRVILYDRWGPVWYEDDGVAPEHTSSDGIRNAVGIANYFFFNKEKNFFTILRFEYGHDETDGVNQDLNRLIYGGVLHFPIYGGRRFPILRDTEGEVEFQFSDTQYPKWDFPFREPRRRDAGYIFRCRLSKKLIPHWQINFYYTYHNNSSRYGLESFSNHTIGSFISFYY